MKDARTQHGRALSLPPLQISSGSLIPKVPENIACVTRLKGAVGREGEPVRGRECQISLGSVCVFTREGKR